MGVALALSATPSEVSAEPTTRETRLFNMINRARTTRGLGPLALRNDLVRMARRHSANMARQRLLFHTPCLSCRFPSGSWRVLAENVGAGGSIRRIHRTMMRSAPHRQNVLGEFDAVGVGVVRRGGLFWATQIFFA